MPLKDNYIRLAKKIYKGPQTAAIRNKIGDSIISSIMRGSNIGVKEALKVAKVLGVTVEELITGKESESEACLIQCRPEEKHICAKLIEILRHDDEIHRDVISHNIDLFCGDRLWVRMGRPERRKKLAARPGMSERRTKIFAYKN